MKLTLSFLLALGLGACSSPPSFQGQEMVEYVSDADFHDFGDFSMIDDGYHVPIDLSQEPRRFRPVANGRNGRVTRHGRRH